MTNALRSHDCLDALGAEQREWLPIALAPDGGLMVGFPGAGGTIRWLGVTMEHAQRVLQGQLEARERGERQINTAGSPTAAMLKHQAYHRKGQWVNGCRWCDEKRGEQQSAQATQAAKQGARGEQRKRQKKISCKEALGNSRVPSKKELYDLGI